MALADAREHWLLESLGTFGERQILRDTICNDCNVALGASIDREFIRTGPEAIHRSSLGLEGEGIGSAFGYRAATTQPVRAQSLSDDPVLFWGTYLGQDTVGPDYFRAVSTMALHFALKANPRLDGTPAH